MRRITLLTAIFLTAVTLAHARGKTSSALTLIEAPGARSASLAEAYTAMTNDVTAFAYNPASLSTLKSSHASFLYQRGIIDDSYGELMLGLPGPAASFGISYAYYDAGQILVFDGVASKHVHAQRDQVISGALSFQIGPVSLGLAEKYFSSQVAERAKAETIAVDAGLMARINSRLHFGGSVRNMGNGVQYVTRTEPLPRTAQLGASWLVKPGKFNPLLMFDAPYYMNEREWRPAVGLEVSYGPMAFRTGYRTGRDLEEFSFGTGFVLGRASIDYAFSLVDQLNSRHRISLSTRFSGPSSSKEISQHGDGRMAWAANGGRR